MGWDAEQFVTPQDIGRSRTVRSLPRLRWALTTLIEPRPRERMLDVGCGYGGLTKFVASCLGIPDMHGVDRDEDALSEARGKGVEVRRCDVGHDVLPYPDEYFDLVVSFGMLDYLPSFDDALHDMRRVLRTGGELVVALPNLGAWHNRLALLRGYQPRDIEVSRRVVVGVHPYYRRDPDRARPTGHIHTVTARAFGELAEHVGFETLSLTGLTPGQPASTTVVRSIDRVFSRLPSLARRFLYIGRKRGMAGR